ncbi:uncharacterized protein [Littorina saxatilis]|uniref:uncharacterized protein n=1 Tax=Littorina saxatilis TaxID=31220 RepID=UPI0038B69C3D
MNCLMRYAKKLADTPKPMPRVRPEAEGTAGLGQGSQMAKVMFNKKTRQHSGSPWREEEEEEEESILLYTDDPLTMASARFRMIGVVLFVVALSALEAYQWDGGPEDKAKMTACLGGKASFPWSILTGSETIVNTAWSFQAPDKEKTIIATYESAHFYAVDTVRFGFLANAGLSIRFARPQDSGNYSVQVQLQQAKSSELVLAEKTVTLSVTDLPPTTQDGSFYVTLSDAVRDDVTQDWTLQLHCGQFVDLGQPPVDVAWKTPSGEVRNSSYRDNDTFVLSVSSPVQGGNYSCRLPPSAPAVRCLTATSPLNAAAQLYVDDKDAILLFCEARQRELEQEKKDQANLLEHQVMQISQQNGTIEDMMQVNKDQTMQISQQNGTIQDMVQVNKDQANLLQHQTMQISQQNRSMAEMKAELVEVMQANKDQANLLEHQAMQISQQNGTIEDMMQVNKDQTMQISQQSGTIQDMMQVNKDQANLLQHKENLLQHQAMQISQQNGTMAEMKAKLVVVMQANKDQSNLLQHKENLLKHQAIQISQQNGTIQDVVQVNKDQANLLQHQAMQISKQNGTIQDMVRCRSRNRMEPYKIWCK